MRTLWSLTICLPVSDREGSGRTSASRHQEPSDIRTSETLTSACCWSAAARSWAWDSCRCGSPRVRISSSQAQERGSRPYCRAHHTIRSQLSKNNLIGYCSKEECSLIITESLCEGRNLKLPRLLPIRERDIVPGSPGHWSLDPDGDEDLEDGDQPDTDRHRLEPGHWDGDWPRHAWPQPLGIVLMRLICPELWLACVSLTPPPTA